MLCRWLVYIPKVLGACEHLVEQRPLKTEAVTRAMLINYECICRMGLNVTYKSALDRQPIFLLAGLKHVIYLGIMLHNVAWGND